MVQKIGFRKWAEISRGVSFTFGMAIIGYFLSFIPGIDRVGPLAAAIIIAVAYRQLFGYPEFFRKGIEFTSKYLLRFAIVLYGLKLNMDIIFQDGIGLLAKGAIAIAIAILLTVFIAKVLKANTQIALLLGVGTGVCGAAAIAAVAPIIESKEDETAISVGMIALAGTVFSVIYALLMPLLPLTEQQYGIWAGLSLHELAHVALAAEPAGEEALGMALLAKLGRVFLLVPLCFILIFWMRRKKAGKAGETASKVKFPYFLIGFIAMSLFGSYVLGEWIPVTDSFMGGISFATTFILTAAMVGLGLNVSLKDVRAKAMRPLLAMLIASIMLSIIMYFVTTI